MASFNRVILIGNLTRDIETRQVGDNTVAKFGIAVNRKYKDKEETTFVDCEAWGRTAEVMAKHTHKGNAVCIEGRLKLDTWEKDGEKRSKLLVVAENFYFLPGGGAAKSDEEKVADKKKAVEEFGDEIPF